MKKLSLSFAWTLCGLMAFVSLVTMASAPRALQIYQGLTTLGVDSGKSCQLQIYGVRQENKGLVRQVKLIAPEFPRGKFFEIRQYGNQLTGLGSLTAKRENYSAQIQWLKNPRESLHGVIENSNPLVMRLTMYRGEKAILNCTRLHLTQDQSLHSPNPDSADAQAL